MTTTRWRRESKKLSVMNTQIIFAGVEEAHLLTAGIIKPILLVHGRDIGSSQIRISFEPIAPRAQLQKTLWLSSSTLTLTWYCGGETRVWRTYNLLLKMVVIYAQIWVPSKAKISKNNRALTFLKFVFLTTLTFPIKLYLQSIKFNRKNTIELLCQNIQIKGPMTVLG